MNRKLTNRYLIPAAVCLLGICGLVFYYFFFSFSARPKTEYIYIDNNDNVDSVLAKLSSIATCHGIQGLRTLLRHSAYSKHIRTGRYAVTPKDGAFKIFRCIKNGQQAPVELTIPSVRTLDRLSAELSKKLMLDSATIYRVLTDEKICHRYGYDTLTIACMFIPNTYDVYWNISPEKLLDRMKRESERFWNFKRREKAKQMGMTENEVITLASIIDEETANDAEKPMVAGMYYNRLKLRNAEYPNGMPLQADPTIKYAWRRFGLRRIYNNLLHIDSPYNTYKNVGLPPGPIRIPSVAGIDAVLDHVHHDYLYMCAKEDFSGTHNFAETYEEHSVNAAKYAKALTDRGIE